MVKGVVDRLAKSEKKEKLDFFDIPFDDIITAGCFAIGIYGLIRVASMGIEIQKELQRQNIKIRQKRRRNLKKIRRKRHNGSR